MKTSEKITEIYKSFIAFQSEVSQPKKNATNPHFKSKYSTLDEIINTVKPTLTKNGLAVIQEVTGDGTNVNIVTRLIHISGEWMETEPLCLKCEKNTPQGQGSATSYGRRYALSAILGISSEDDDDGNHATGNKQPTEPVKKYENPIGNYKKLMSDEQRKKLFATIGKDKANIDIAKQVQLELFNYTSSTEIEAKNFDKIFKEIEKRIRNLVPTLDNAKEVN